MDSKNRDTEAVSLGHDPDEHLGSLKPPIYETSTFVFESAEQGKRFFEVTYGLDDARDDEEFGFIYSRLDSPNAHAAEARLAALESAEAALVFNGGMAAITTVFLTYLRPGSQILYSTPAYGGTSKLLEGLFTDMGVVATAFTSDVDEESLRRMVADNLAMIYVETPANPTNDIFDIEMAVRVAHDHDAVLAVDNTFLTPVWQRPLELGADLSIHSATKYLGGHSDLTAGVVCGSEEELAEIRHNRYRFGTMAQPQTAWLLARSIETFRLRVEQQTSNATRVATFLESHPKVASVNHLSLLGEDDPRQAVHAKQASGPGAMISFEVIGEEAGAFRFLNAMRLVHLAVSLGGTESLASHPWTMSHSTVAAEEKRRIGVTPGLIRFSVGIEDADDLISDLDQALDHV